MEQPLYKKPQTPDFSNPNIQLAFIEQSNSSKELLQKELDVNQAEQNLLKKRISMMKEFINNLPASDPQYSMLVIQVQMDQIEWDELKVREDSIIQKLQLAK